MLAALYGLFVSNACMACSVRTGFGSNTQPPSPRPSVVEVKWEPEVLNSTTPSDLGCGSAAAGDEVWRRLAVNLRRSPVH